MRLKIVAANWKMNKDLKEGLALASRVMQLLDNSVKYSGLTILFPSFIHLDAVSKLLLQSRRICIGAQDCHEHAFGAFTGEISAPMLRSVGVTFVLVGHSERRKHLDEEEGRLAKKVDMALLHGLRPVFCCGESKEIRMADRQESFVKEQLAASLFHLSAQQIRQVIIAYEPVWAIGTGSTPTPTQVQAMHSAIRNAMAYRYGEEVAQNISILYGGSCNSQNAVDFFGCPDVDGGLIGTASLDAASFVSIVNAIE